MKISTEQTINIKKYFCVHFVRGGGITRNVTVRGEQQKGHT